MSLRRSRNRASAVSYQLSGNLPRLQVTTIKCTLPSLRDSKSEALEFEEKA